MQIEDISIITENSGKGTTADGHSLPPSQIPLPPLFLPATFVIHINQASDKHSLFDQTLFRFL